MAAWLVHESPSAVQHGVRRVAEERTKVALETLDQIALQLSQIPRALVLAKIAKVCAL
jgi:hypothetical protein